ncbi:G patch domain-containing protein 3 [Trichinella nativa]|uniref:G patch domain-containing protein 3 n=1 Tax=Trichinella nativa TaxID=6335 RepID=A0A0V1LK52_9BILA|nr:G patch domain-containing protein 3 [Trichinella nativa]
MKEVAEKLSLTVTLKWSMKIHLNSLHTQCELNDFIRDLGLSKVGAEILGSGLQSKHICLLREQQYVDTHVHIAKELIKIMNKTESSSGCESSGDKLVYAVVRNIPKNFRSKHLRQFFSTFVEEQRFHCFHYLHCPEIIQAEQFFCKEDDAPSKTERSFNNKNYALVLMSLSDRDLFIRRYHGKDWALHSELNVDGKCCIVKCKDPHSFLSLSQQSNGTKGISYVVMRQLKPPALLPNGNVGTPTSVILNFIKQCKFPPHMIRKLGIYDRTSLSSQRSGVEIPFAYATQPVEASEYSTTSILKELSEEEDGDDDQCEEWERHEAFYDDPGKQDRLKETLYEEEMEIVWEKGGPGLVFNTDAFQRSQAENDTDEKWADQWDIDMSAYYAEGSEEYDSADKDARDSLEIRRMAMIQSGQLSDSVFKQPSEKETVGSSGKKYSKKSTIEESLDRMKESEFGAFEKYTKGIGLKLLLKQGWKEGSGLGRTGQGSALPVALEMLESAQTGKEKAGFAYRGEKLQRRNFPKKSTEKHIISTIYDDEQITDLPDSNVRNNAKNFTLPHLLCLESHDEEGNETFLTSVDWENFANAYRLFSFACCLFSDCELTSGKCFYFFSVGICIQTNVRYHRRLSAPDITHIELLRSLSCKNIQDPLSPSVDQAHHDRVSLLPGKLFFT